MHKYLYHVLFPLCANLLYLFIFFVLQSNISCSYFIFALCFFTLPVSLLFLQLTKYYPENTRMYYNCAVHHKHGIPDPLAAVRRLNKPVIFCLMLAIMQ